jgi:hypothetical protein
MHEQEVRVATFCDGREKGRIIRGIQTDHLIKEIILSPRWPHKESQAVTRVLKKSTLGKSLRSFGHLNCSGRC